MTRPRYVDSGTGKIAGPINNYKYAGGSGGGEPGDDIQDINESNSPGTNDEFARDNHVHEGVHSVSADGVSHDGDISVLAGYNVDIEMDTVPENRLRIIENTPEIAELYYDGGECMEEVPLVLLGVGPCSDNQVTLSDGLSKGSGLGDILTPLPLSHFEIVHPGVYFIKYDLSCFGIGNDPPIIKGSVAVNGVNSYIKALAYSGFGEMGNEFSAHGILPLDTGDVVALRFTNLVQETVSLAIVHLLFQIRMIHRY